MTTPTTPTPRLKWFRVVASFCVEAYDEEDAMREAMTNLNEDMLIEAVSEIPEGKIP